MNGKHYHNKDEFDDELWGTYLILFTGNKILVQIMFVSLYFKAKCKFPYPKDVREKNLFNSQLGLTQEQICY